MIPQQSLTRSVFGNGVSCRIEACRRRLRTVRTEEMQARLEERCAELTLKPVGTHGDTSDMSFGKFERQGSDEAEIT